MYFFILNKQVIVKFLFVIAGIIHQNVSRGRKGLAHYTKSNHAW